jgi:hypothetical protein
MELRALTTSTLSIITNYQREFSDDYIENEIIKNVRNANSLKDAIYNLRLILKEYDKRKTALQCLKMFFNR